jgi:hypothetical protein
MIDTDTLRVSLVLRVSSDDQEREQGSPKCQSASELTSRRAAGKQLGVSAPYAQFQLTLWRV